MNIERIKEIAFKTLEAAVIGEIDSDKAKAIASLLREARHFIDYDSPAMGVEEVLKELMIDGYIDNIASRKSRAKYIKVNPNLTPEDLGGISLGPPDARVNEELIYELIELNLQIKKEKWFDAWDLANVFCKFNSSERGLSAYDFDEKLRGMAKSKKLTVGVKGRYKIPTESK